MAGGAGSAGAAAAPARDGAAGASGAGGSAGAPGAAGATGAAAAAGSTAVLLHTRLTTVRGKAFVVRYVAAKGSRLVLVIRRRTGLAGTRLAALTTSKSGRGSITARHALAPGIYTLVLTSVTAAGARVVDTVPLVVKKA
jgi:hypothetical protein